MGEVHETLRALNARVAELESAQARARQRRRGLLRLASAAALCLPLLWAGSVSSQCDQILPTPMHTLCGGTPAIANDINDNFRQVIDWVELKAGPLDDQTIGTAALQVAGNARVDGALEVGEGLPIVIEAPETRTLSNGAAETSFIVAPDDGRRACFLTRFRLHDTMGNNSEAFCWVYQKDSNWVLTYDVDDGTASDGPDIYCTVQCITW